MFAGAIAIILMQAATPAATATATGAGAGPGAIASPDWLRRPTSEDISRYYPKAAIAEDLAGRAILTCNVSAEGRLEGCSAQAVTPDGAGFGEAAMAMSEVFRMRPQTRDGRPVAGGTVRIPLTFIMAANLRAGAVRARHPDVANEIIELDCRFRGQRVDNCFVRGGATPKGAEVAMKAAEDVTLPKLPTRRPQGRIVLPIVFVGPSGAFEPPNFVTKPRWRSRPSAAEVAHAYPEPARKAGLVGNAIIDCKIEARGELSGCEVHQEDPAGTEFGEAALTLMPKFRLDEVDSYGLKVEGRRIRLPIRLSPALPPTQ